MNRSSNVFPVASQPSVYHFHDNNTKYSTNKNLTSITTENSCEEEIDLWTTLINDAASKMRAQYDDILQVLLMEGDDESEAKQPLKKFYLYSKRS